MIKKMSTTWNSPFLVIERRGLYMQDNLKKNPFLERQCTAFSCVLHCHACTDGCSTDIQARFTTQLRKKYSKTRQQILAPLMSVTLQDTMILCLLLVLLRVITLCIYNRWLFKSNTSRVHHTIHKKVFRRLHATAFSYPSANYYHPTITSSAPNHALK